MDVMTLLTTRQSPVKLAEPAPTAAQLDGLLRAAMRAPDHGRLRPWRFLTLKDGALERFGDLLAESLRRREPGASPEALQREREKALRAPMAIVVSATVQRGHKVPEVEQLLAAAAATQNLVLAAHAQGLGAMWRTGAAAYDPIVKQALGIAPEDAIVGIVYLGTPAMLPRQVASTDYAGFVREWAGDVPAHAPAAS